jgi:RNA polymerase sigma-70 factor (ECF subfamily)
MSPETRDQVVAARDGDLTAFEELVVRYRKPLCAFVSTVVDHYHDAQDIAQEAFLTAHRQLPSLRDAATFPTWLFRIAYRQSVNAVRHRDRRRSMVDRIGEARFSGREIREGTASFEAVGPEAEEERAHVREALASMKGEWASALVLRYYEGLTCREIGEVLGIAVENVRIRLHRGREALRHKLRFMAEGVESHEVRGGRASPRGA